MRLIIKIQKHVKKNCSHIVTVLRSYQYFCLWMNDYKPVVRGRPGVFERHCEQVYMKLWCDVSSLERCKSYWNTYFLSHGDRRPRVLTIVEIQIFLAKFYGSGSSLQNILVLFPNIIFPHSRLLHPRASGYFSGVYLRMNTINTAWELWFNAPAVADEISRFIRKRKFLLPRSQ